VRIERRKHHTSEGTLDVHSLVLGQAITGFNAFK